VRRPSASAARPALARLEPPSGQPLGANDVLSGMNVPAGMRLTFIPDLLVRPVAAI